MAKTFLDYFKTILPQFSFDSTLLVKEYRKALQLLNPSEQTQLNRWLAKQNLSPILISVK